MAKSNKAQKQAIRELQKMQTAGFTALFIGVIMFISPFFAGNSKLLKPLAQNLSSSISGWFILIGIGLIGLYALIKPKSKTDNIKEVKTVNTKAPIKTDLITPEKPIEILTAALCNTTINITEPISQWSKQVFADIEWRRFEAVCKRLFAQSGLKIKSTDTGPDGGVDIWMYSAKTSELTSIAQCKHYKGKQVDAS
jgi:restriction system protein